MSAKSVLYKGVYLHPNSLAYQLHQDNKFKELEVHMRDVEARYKQLKEKQ
jgi:hypothetical protein